MKKTILMMCGLLLGAAVASAAPITPDGNNDNGATQTLTVGGQSVSRVVREIHIDGNNAVLLFTDGGKLEADMRHVTLTMSYSEPTGLPALRLTGADGSVKVYDLQGRPVAESQLENGSLPNGVYIVGGKKVSYKKK